LLPIVYYLEKKLNLNVKMCPGIDARYYTDIYKPHLLLVPNSTGDKNYVRAVKYASKRNIPIISLKSEGDMTEEKFQEMMWGENKEHIFYEDINLQWTKRNRDLVIKHHPDLKKRIFVSGGMGFDRYKIYNFMTKRELTSKYNKNFKKIICLVGWGFDQFLGEFFESSKERYIQIFGKKQINLFRKDRKILNEIYKKLIQENKDVLFLLKYHPGIEKRKKNTEFDDLQKYDNTLEIQHQENIADCISASDLIIAYDSTVALEAWLMKKQTLLINPTNEEFPRSEISKGSPIFKDYIALQKAISDFYKTGMLKGFKKKEADRGKIIKEIVGKTDGKNHKRTALIIKKFFDKNKYRKIQNSNPLYYVRNILIHMIFTHTKPIIKWNFINKIPLPKIKFLSYCQKIYKQKDIYALKRKYYPALNAFHMK
jgi:surface carbohydrate biosynthesis protein